ncbi:hypothetical protein N0B16_13800 [Chryseobacterium sp. GMJ5]|uniref:Uncharacterized protein n=2 Tax=Chryseobacterium gilvum TaxID=2976534 RepID=A0ABT2VZS5_9FLAO|nr:hypothetical protein [Chryseobacterium gilvum]
MGKSPMFLLVNFIIFVNNNYLYDKYYKVSNMNSKTIHALIKNYRENQLNAISQNMGITDAHSVWFDLPTLKNFISRIESESSNINSEITEHDLGIRLYFAAYPQGQEWTDMKTQDPDFFLNNPLTDDYAGKQTLIMIPTLKMADDKENVYDYDFNPLDETTFSQRQGGHSASTASAVETMALNHGSLIPPANPIVETY